MTRSTTTPPGIPEAVPPGIRADRPGTAPAEKRPHHLRGDRGSSGSEITSWVESHFTSTTVGGVTVYDLTSPTS